MNHLNFNMMKTNEVFELLKPEFEKLDEIKEPGMPVSAYVIEATQLKAAADDDKEDFVNGGFDWTLAESIPQRCEALSHIQAIWVNEMDRRKDVEEQWMKQKEEAEDLRAELIHTFRYVFRKDDDSITIINRIDVGDTNDDLVQDLKDLAVLASNNKEKLVQFKMDDAEIDRIYNFSTQLATLLGEANDARTGDKDIKLQRDKAYTYLKIAVDEVRDFGKYLYWRTPDRLGKYSSKYFRR